MFKLSSKKEKGNIVRTTIELKKEIVSKYQSGVRVSTLAMYRMAKSTTSVFLRNKVMIKAADVAKRSTLITNQRPQILKLKSNSLYLLRKKASG